MNYFNNREIIIKNNDGNHVNGDPEFSGYTQEVELIKCETEGCQTEMEYHEHYINGGLCWKCIERIGR